MEPIILTYFYYNKETESWPESKAALSIEKWCFHSTFVYPSPFPPLPYNVQDHSLPPPEYSYPELQRRACGYEIIPLTRDN